MISRYFADDGGYGCNLIKAPDGDYVLHTDYAALEARCAEMEMEMEMERDALQASLDSERTSIDHICKDYRQRTNELDSLRVQHKQALVEREEFKAKLAAAEEALRHTCKHLCQWKDACEVGCPVSAALADTTTGEAKP